VQKKRLLTSFDLGFLVFTSLKLAWLVKNQKAQRYAPGFSFAEEEGFEPIPQLFYFQSLIYFNFRLRHD
jgi:hypothetical protein